MKKCLPYILIILILLTATLGPFGAGVAEAWSFQEIIDFIANPTGEITEIVIGSINDKVKGWTYDKVRLGFAYISYGVNWITSWLVWIAAQVFDLTLDYTLKNDALANISAVQDGWRISRDLVNMFFIFILLFIAIATILQLAKYDTKKLLATLIMAALLVNFSLVITKVVIDASNVLAMEFYDKMDITNPPDGKADISQIMMKGFGLQTLYGKPPSEGGPDLTLGVTEVIIAGIMGIFLTLTTAFVLFAAAFLFAMRTVVLFFLMILSPFAFLFMILPKTQQYASQWWSTLFSQSFFAPAFLFLIYIVMKIVSSGGLQASIEGGNPGIMGVVVHYMLLIGMMMGALVLAKSMANAGTHGVFAYADKARGWVQGKAGKISRRGAGYAAESLLDEKSRINKLTGGRVLGAVKKIPLATRGLAQVSSWREKQIAEKGKKATKTYGDYSLAGLKAIQKPTDKADAPIAKLLATEMARRGAAKSVLEKKEDAKAKKDLEKEGRKQRGDWKRELDTLNTKEDFKKLKDVGLDIQAKLDKAVKADNPEAYAKLEKEMKEKITDNQDYNTWKNRKDWLEKNIKKSYKEAAVSLLTADVEKLKEKGGETPKPAAGKTSAEDNFKI